MDLLRPVRAFDRHQQAHTRLAIPVAVLKKFSDDQAGSMSAVIAYYAFFSLFPLLLVCELQREQLQGRTLSVVIGLITSLWAGLGVTQAAENAFEKVWAVPARQRPDFLRKRLRGFALLAVLGALFIVSSAASGLVTGGLGGPALKIFGVVFSLAVNCAVFAAAFRLLTAASVPTGQLWVGVLVGSVLWEILQALGGFYVDQVVRHASNTYGVFALVIGLLAWLHVGALMTVYAAEINVVLVRHMWPRRLLDPPAEP